MRKFEIYRNETKFYVVCAGMIEGADDPSDEYDGGCGVLKFSGGLENGSLRYGEAVALVDGTVRKKWKAQ